MAQMRDPYTAGHQRRVAKLALGIGRHIGPDDDRCRAIHVASLLHDIGKIKIPAELLNKPGRLTDIELVLIRTHPMGGYEKLSTVDFPWPVADIVLQHHEPHDGTGYPQGLTTEPDTLRGPPGTRSTSSRA